MAIREIIKYKDYATYIKLQNIFKDNKKEGKEIKLGDKPENLMRHNAYKREGRRIKQTKWG